MALAEEGYYVLVTDVDEAGAKAVAEELNRVGSGRAEALYLDVTDAQAVAAAVHRVKAEHGRLDMMFNNAGVFVGGPVEEITLEHWRIACEVMVMGVVNGVDAAYKVMVEQGFGSIVNTASMAGLTPFAFMAPYNMAKHAVVGLTMALRGEAGAHGVRVACVCPIAINTNLLTHVNGGLGGVPEGDFVGSLYERFGHYARYIPNFILMSPEVHGRKVLRAAERNRAYVIEPWYGRQVWWLSRLAPTAPARIGGVASRGVRAARPLIAKLADRLTA